MICVKFIKEGFVLKQAHDDTGDIISKSVLKMENGTQYIGEVGKDMDSLVIMAASTTLKAFSS